MQSVEIHQRLMDHESAQLRGTPHSGHFLVRLLGELEEAFPTKKLWAERRQLWHAPENRLINKLHWFSVTSRYLWSRLKDKRQARQTMQALQKKSALFTHLTD
jgi:hypothetical protein